MQTVTLLRHAKSSWADANQSDYDRPLNKRGNNDAPEMARRLVERDAIPGIILSSSAQRTRETTAHLLEVFGTQAPVVQYHEALYLASPGTMLELMETVADKEHIMLIAHNPGMEDLSAHLQGIVDDTMPTAAIRQFSCTSIAALCKQLRTSDKDYDPQSDHGARLAYSDYPKNIAK